MKAIFTEAYELSFHLNFVALFYKDRVFLKYVMKKGIFYLSCLLSELVQIYRSVNLG